jgi:hypothetical protein
MHFTSLLVASILAAVPTAIAAPPPPGEANVMSGCCCGRSGAHVVVPLSFPVHVVEGRMQPKGTPPKELLGCVSRRPRENNYTFTDPTAGLPLEWK